MGHLHQNENWRVCDPVAYIDISDPAAVFGSQIFEPEKTAYRGSISPLLNPVAVTVAVKSGEQSYQGYTT